jgi:hypothetical protein
VVISHTLTCSFYAPSRQLRKYLQWRKWLRIQVVLVQVSMLLLAPPLVLLLQQILYIQGLLN